MKLKPCPSCGESKVRWLVYRTKATIMCRHCWFEVTGYDTFRGDAKANCARKWGYGLRDAAK